MVKNSEILKDISKWSYDGRSTIGGGNLIYLGEGENKGKAVELDDGENWEEIVRAFFKEIKQNPQGWKLGKHPDPDPYSECITVEHKSGRKHYTPEHGIWGFNIPDFREEWNEIQNILGKEGKNDKPNSPGEPNQETQRPWWKKKETWFIIFGVIIVIIMVTIAYFLTRKKEK